MNQLARRHLLTGMLGAGALAMTGAARGSSALAAAAHADKQAPGFYRYKVGSIQITAITDGAVTQPLPETYVRNAGRNEVSAALRRLHMGGEKITAPFTPLVVNTGSRLVVIDTGMGAAAYEQTKGAVGQFHTNLMAAGIDRQDVDAVVISHLHRDHINGLLTADNKPAFPNAEILVPEPEWKFWSDEGNLSRMTAGSIPEINFKNARRVFSALNNRVTQYQPEREVIAGITAVATPGHTPGHMSHLIASGQDKIFVQADLTAFTALLFVRNPGWHVFFDMDSSQAEQSRRRIYDMAVTEDMPIQGYHFPFPAVGHIEKDGPNYRFEPSPWNPVL